MNVWEIGITAAAAAVPAGYVSGILTVRYRMLAALAAGAAIIGWSIAADGIRIRMLLLYACYAVYLLLFGIYALRRRTLALHGKPARWKRATVGIMGAVYLAAALAVMLYALPPIKLDKPTGPYAVGMADYEWTDDTRDETFTPDAADRRTVSVRIWYPADRASALAAKPAPYAYEQDQMKQIRSSQPLLIQALLDSMAKAKTHSYLQARPAADLPRYPVLLLSPGYGMSNFMYTGIAENMASCGYIVAALQHPYYSILPTPFRNGQTTDSQASIDDPFDWEAMNRHMQLWKADIRFILHQLDRLNLSDRQHNLLAGVLDLTRIGMLGDSFGGAAAAQMLAEQPRLLAGVNIDGFPYGDVITNGLSHPLLWIQTSDTQAFRRLALTRKEWSDPADYGFVSEESYHNTAAEVNRRAQAMLSRGGEEWTLQGADHWSFSDMMLYSPLLYGKRSSGLANRLNERLLLFFDEHVKSVSINEIYW